MLLRETTHNEESKQTAWCFIESRRIRDALVELDQVLLANAEAGVKDLDLDALKGFLGRYLNRCGRLGELRSVVQELSKQVSHIGNDVALHCKLRNVANLDPFEELDLGKRRSNNVFHSDRATPLTWGTVASKHEQRLCVTTHSSSQMVDLIETGEGLGVLLVLLEVRDQVDHAVVQLLVSTAETNEHLRHVSATLCLVTRDVYRGFLNLVEGVHQRTNLIVGFTRNWTDRGNLIGCTEGTKAGHRERQALSGRRVSVVHQTAQRSKNRTADHEDQREQQQRAEYSKEGEQ